MILVTDKVTDPVQCLLNILGEEEKGATQLMSLLKIKHRGHFGEYYLKPALALGVIEMTIPNKPTSSKQKYRKAK